MTGQGYNNKGKQFGHAWIVDGFSDKECHIFTYATQPPSVMVTHDQYNHINWGDNGMSNGYFYDGVFTANAAHSYDFIGSPWMASFTFNIDQFSVYL